MIVETLPTLQQQRANKIHQLEAAGVLDPTCKGCDYAYLWYRTEYNPEYGRHAPFSPPHKASDRCRSGKYAHCTCETCW